MRYITVECEYFSAKFVPNPAPLPELFLSEAMRIHTGIAFLNYLHFLCCLNWLKERFYDAIAYFCQDLRVASRGVGSPRPPTSSQLLVVLELRYAPVCSAR
jgi:hypothetical protein